ncbi:MAG: DUF1573 domain-containing protein [Bacteroidales bacterium]|nr:DUF1573 domain-containing protein [Bacteroidales bacterium]
MKYFFSILLFLTGFFQESFAQIMNFDSDEYDFGSINELSGAVSHRFEYTNTGNRPLIIHSVKTSCGCTSPDWSKQPVPPQKKGYIDVTFDPRDRVGSFSKSIIIKSNASKDDIILYISGNVIAREEPVSAEYPFTMFDLRLKTNTVNFNRIPFDQTTEQTIDVINPTKANIKVEADKANTSGYIKIVAEPEILKPGEKGIVKCIFNPEKYGKFDYINFEVPILVNTYAYKLIFKAFVTESQTKETQQNSSVFTLIDDKEISLGDFMEGDTAVYIVKFKNTGNSPLIIRAIRNACDCLTYETNEKPIKENQEGQIKIMIDTHNRPGKQSRYITVITNSISTPNTVLKFNLNVKKTE